MAFRPGFALALTMLACAPVSALPDDGEVVGFAPDVDLSAPASPAAAESFTGEWVFDQPTHGEYEASRYELQPGGALRRLGVISRPTDHVLRAGVRCRFGESWSAPRRELLRIALRCHDGRARRIEFHLPRGPAPGRHAVDFTVDGERGWTHPGFAWSILRRADGADAFVGASQ